MGPHPAVAQVRSAVRRELRDLADARSALVLVAVSGGADSLALLAATCFVAPRLGVRAGAVTVDHGMQGGSLQRARAVAAAAHRAGADPVSIWHVTLEGSGGPEARARRARYAALGSAAASSGAESVLVAHTRDDQAETVLLGLARGSGARSLAGMPPRSGLVRRPLLGLPRHLVRQAAEVAAHDFDIGVWDDPHNEDPAYARPRVRHRVMPVLEDELGPGVAAALARTAALLRDDADALDGWSAQEASRLVRTGPDGTRDVDAIGVSDLPRAVRARVLRQAAVDAGAPVSALTAGHVAAMEALVVGDVGGAVADLPRVSVRRVGGLLRVAPVHPR